MLIEEGLDFLLLLDTLGVIVVVCLVPLVSRTSPLQEMPPRLRLLGTETLVLGVPLSLPGLLLLLIGEKDGGGIMSIHSDRLYCGSCLWWNGTAEFELRIFLGD